MKFTSMDGQDESINERIKKLIKVSTNFKGKPSREYQRFHESFLKFSFNALDVVLDYENESIQVWNAKPTSAYSIELHNYQEAFFERVHYTNLEETLSGCVEEGSFPSRFYLHLLQEYGSGHDSDEKERSA